MSAKVISGVPPQNKGAYHDTESEMVCNSIEVATSKFEIVKSRFFEINRWKEFAGKFTAEFTLMDKLGIKKKGLPEVGDFVKIDIPAPGNPEGDGYDWVEIIDRSNKSEEAEERYLMTMRPSRDPQKNEEEIAHFYNEAASSTFIIRRSGAKLFASVHGRNEMTNNEDISLTGKIRNTVVALMGMVGIAKIEWKNLIEGFLNYKENG